MQDGYFIEPTVFTDVKPEHADRAGRDLWPCDVASFRSRTLDEAIEIVNGVEYGLSSAIYTQDVNNAFHAMQELYTGICYVNSATIGAEVHLPFGGTKGHRQRPSRSRHAGARYL